MTTPTRAEQLAKIEALCRAGLTAAEKRRKGKWHTGDTNDHWRREVRDASGQGIAWCGFNPESEAHATATYIAHCAGPAEAGWRATIAAIEGLRAEQEIIEKKLDGQTHWAGCEHDHPLCRAHIRILAALDAIIAAYADQLA